MTNPEIEEILHGDRPVPPSTARLKTGCPATARRVELQWLPEEEDAGILCPACQETLRFAALDGIKSAACPACRGVLLLRAQFRERVDSLRASYSGTDVTPEALESDEVDAERQCPACGQPLETFPYAGPGNCVIDSCVECDLVWLDDGELARIVLAPGRRAAGPRF